MKENYCSGCVDDFYNDHNPYGVKECWSLKTATVVKAQFVHLDQAPPWKNPMVKTFSCHRRKGYVKVRQEAKNG